MQSHTIIFTGVLVLIHVHVQIKEPSIVSIFLTSREIEFHASVSFPSSMPATRSRTNSSKTKSWSSASPSLNWREILD